MYNYLIDKIKKQHLKVDISLIETAINYIKLYHHDQTRHSGEAYFYHPLEVASIVIDYLFDTETIIAALLHDVVEDTSSSLQQIEFIFGTRIASIVCTLSKITGKYQLSKTETFYKINNFQDTENKAIIIKVIDRLHNMRTIHYIKSVEKQKRIANETLKVYIPLAKFANLFQIERELNSIVLKVLNLNP